MRASRSAKINIPLMLIFITCVVMTTFADWLDIKNAGSNPAVAVADQPFTLTDSNDSGSPASLNISSKIKHIVILVQENHSFDNYFGTFPGAEGIILKRAAN